MNDEVKGGGGEGNPPCLVGLWPPYGWPQRVVKMLHLGSFRSGFVLVCVSESSVLDW